MDTETSSIAASRDGHALRQGESVFDDYDEVSNATIGTSSPVAHPGMKSPHSDSKSRMSLDAMSPSFGGSTIRVFCEPPRQLALSNHNLHGFTRRVETGDVPLRVDFIPDDAYVNYGTNVLTLNFERNEATHRRGSSVLAAAGRTVDLGDLGSDVADSATQYSNASFHGGQQSIEGNGWNTEDASVDPQVGSPTRHHIDPLNSASLDQHLHELSCGPAPLRVENIVSSSVPYLQRERNESTTTLLPETTVASLMVESSEVDAMSTSEVISLPRIHHVKRTSVGDAMDDMWSTTSTHGFDTMYFSTGKAKDETLHALSKENLRQLRHQLESGETPLRPEVLAGLSTMVQAMTQTKSTKPTSTTVEPTMTEERSKLVDSAAFHGSSLHSCADTGGSFLLNSRNLAKNGDGNAVAGISLQHAVADMPAREACDSRARGPSDYPNPEFLHSTQADVSDRDVDDEVVVDEAEARNEDEEEDALQEKRSTSDGSCEGQNESVFNMTEDDGVDDLADPASMSRHMRELFKLVQEGRQDQSHLRQLVLEQRSLIQYLQNTVKDLEAELSALKRD